MLTNRITQQEREVDIVIEGKLDGEPVTICLEVVERRRPADVGWVEGMLKKHENLPTNRLLLISQSGFTYQAIALIESQSGRVKALTPEVGDDDLDSGGIRRIITDSLTTHADGCTVRLIAPPNAERLRVRLEADTEVYDEDGNVLGLLGYLVREAMNLPNVRDSFLGLAREHSDPDSLRGFQALFPIPQLRYIVYNRELDRPELIEALEIWGSVVYRQDEVRLSAAELDGRKYRFGEGLFVGRPAVWVETVDESATSGKLSWRWVDRSAPDEEEYIRHFAGLRDINAPIESLTEDFL